MTLGGRSWRRGFVLAGALAALALGPGSAAVGAADIFPVFETISDDHMLGEANGLGLQAYDLDASGATAQIVMTTPAGFGASVVQAAQTKIGSSELGVVSATGGKITEYSGSLLVMDAAAYAADTGAQACAAGTHTAYWRMNLANVAAGNLSIPIAVDPAGGGYRLTICFGAVQALGRQVSDVYLGTSDVFRNPVKHGNYLFDATVTPFASDGTLNGASAYEIRAYDLLPQILSSDAAYDAAAKTLTVTGKLTADNRPRSDTNVHLYGGASADADKWTDLGFVVTGKDGSYTLTKSLGKNKFPYVYAHVNHYRWQTCKGSSAAPGGCASYSIDGRSTSPTKVVLAAAVESTTGSAHLKSVLLGAAALDQLPGAPTAGFVLAPASQSSYPQNPDPRAPCGAAIDVPSFRSGALEAFVSTAKVAVIEWGNTLAPGAATAFVKKQIADTRSGCPPYTTTGSGGTKQVNRLVGVLSLPAVTDANSTVVLRVSDSTGSGYIAAIAIQRGAVLELAQVIGVGRPQDAFVKGLAIALAKQLDQLKA